jgi:hypothetical protein
LGGTQKQVEEKGTIADAASAYYYLQKTVKCESEKDNIWMTFYEGLHRHSALILSLLSSTFNIKEIVFKNKSLNFPSATAKVGIQHPFPVEHNSFGFS